jgi:hypothetical protein
LFLNRYEEEPASWSDAEKSIAAIDASTLMQFQDREDLLAPLLEKHVSPPNKRFRDALLEIVSDRIEVFASNTITTVERAVNPLRLVEIPPPVAIFRGFSGSDCSSRYSFPYPNDPNVRTYFVYGHQEDLKGYVSTVDVDVHGQPSLYVITINGKQISGADTGLILRGLYQDRAR